MSWTEDRIERLRQLWGSGKSASEIADMLGGVSRNAVIGKAHRLGLSGRPSPIKAKPEEEAEAAPAAAPTSVASPAPARPAPVREAVQEGANILSLTERMCRWPLGDPKQAGFRFCGKGVFGGLPYCMEHATLAYQAPKKKEDRKAVG